jgi:predicted DNA binding CopG/RHH family protein
MSGTKKRTTASESSRPEESKKQIERFRRLAGEEKGKVSTVTIRADTELILKTKKLAIEIGVSWEKMLSKLLEIGFSECT